MDQTPQWFFEGLDQRPRDSWAIERAGLSPLPIVKQFGGGRGSRFQPARTNLNMGCASLYRRVLKERFDALPAALQRFHDAPGGGRARGKFRVEHAVGWPQRRLASVMGLPKEGADVPVELRVVVDGERERWIRNVGGQILTTIQWEANGRLMERFGAAVLACSLALETSVLRYDFERSWFIGVPLPRWLSPFVVGAVDGGDRGWQVSTRIVAPFLGTLVHYSGWVEPESR
jgi:Domain of unknown function (DUF4166)